MVATETGRAMSTQADLAPELSIASHIAIKLWDV